jgi:hypothetical protein
MLRLPSARLLTASFRAALELPGPDRRALAMREQDIDFVCPTVHRFRRMERRVARRARKAGRASFAPYPWRSRPHKTDPTFGRGPGVDSISFAVHPRTVGEVQSTPAVRPGRPAAPSRSPPPVFLVGDVFHLPLKVRSSIAFTLSTRWMPAARSSMDSYSGFWACVLVGARSTAGRRPAGVRCGRGGWTEHARRRG